jgi:hypothetical protein
VHIDPNNQVLAARKAAIDEARSKVGTILSAAVSVLRLRKGFAMPSMSQFEWFVCVLHWSKQLGTCSMHGRQLGQLVKAAADGCSAHGPEQTKLMNQVLAARKAVIDEARWAFTCVQLSLYTCVKALLYANSCV